VFELRSTAPHPNRNYHKPAAPLFISGIIPLSWINAAQSAGGSSLVVGLYLWHLRGLRKTKTALVVTRKGAMASLNIGRCSLQRGLDRLQEAQLISTNRKSGSALRVTILDVVDVETPTTSPSSKYVSCGEGQAPAGHVGFPTII